MHDISYNIRIILHLGDKMETIKILIAGLKDYPETTYQAVKESGKTWICDRCWHPNENYSGLTGAIMALFKMSPINFEPNQLVSLATGGEKVANDMNRRFVAPKYFSLRSLRGERKELQGHHEMESAVIGGISNAGSNIQRSSKIVNYVWEVIKRYRDKK
jgi:hypothetical protein